VKYRRQSVVPFMSLTPPHPHTPTELTAVTAPMAIHHGFRVMARKALSTSWDSARRSSADSMSAGELRAAAAMMDTGEGATGSRCRFRSNSLATGQEDGIRRRWPQVTVTGEREADVKRVHTCGDSEVNVPTDILGLFRVRHPQRR
jgi:hypothetical protein